MVGPVLGDSGYMLGPEPRPATLPDLLNLSTSLYARRPALVMRQGLRDDRWTYGRLQRASDDWASYFESRGLEPGQRVLVQSHGSPTLIAAMFGAFRRGLVLVPLDLQSTMAFTRRVAADTQARAYIAPVDAQVPEGLPHIPLRPLARSLSNPTNHVVRSNDLAEIIFTSGTTSQPKGVMLTHGNITSNVRAAAVLPHGPDHRLLSVLPISHMLEQTGGIFFPLASGASVAFAHSIRSSTLMAAFAERHPTTLVAVPRLLDLLIQGIVQDVEKRGRLSHWNAAHRMAEHLPRAARRLLFLPVHRVLGGSLRWIFSGGSALDPRLQATWQRMGISVLQGYGATECSPFVSCQRPYDNATSTTGPPFPE